MKVAIASDHGGYALKEIIRKHLEDKGNEYTDCGTHSEESCDYPDYAELACTEVLAGKAQFGILICGTGIGIGISANKIRGIRAALCHDEYSARYARAHNDANVLTMGARVIGSGLAESIVDVFLAGQFEGGRHARRVAKIAAIEAKNNE